MPGGALQQPAQGATYRQTSDDAPAAQRRRRVRSLANVEVRKNADATLWYDAMLCDMVGLNARIHFEGGVWPSREVPCAMVRLRPPSADEIAAWDEAPDLEDGDDEDLPLARTEQPFEEGTPIEVRVAASGRNPAGWALGRITAAPTDGVVSVEVEGRQGTNLSVTMDALRHRSTEPPLDPLTLVRKCVQVDEALHDWAACPDASGCLEHIQMVAGLALVSVGSRLHGSVGPPKAAGAQHRTDAIMLIGSKAACRRGEMLLKIHMMHQREVEAPRMEVALNEQSSRKSLPRAAPSQAETAPRGGVEGRGKRRMACESFV